MRSKPPCPRFRKAAAWNGRVVSVPRAGCLSCRDAPRCQAAAHLVRRRLGVLVRWRLEQRPQGQVHGREDLLGHMQPFPHQQRTRHGGICMKARQSGSTGLKSSLHDAELVTARTRWLARPGRRGRPGHAAHRRGGRRALRRPAAAEASPPSVRGIKLSDTGSPDPREAALGEAGQFLVLGRGERRAGGDAGRCQAPSVVVVKAIAG